MYDQRNTAEKVLVGDVAETLTDLHVSIAQEWVYLEHQEVVPDYVHLFITAHQGCSTTIVKIVRDHKIVQGSLLETLEQYPDHEMKVSSTLPTKSQVSQMEQTLEICR